ncbi:MAG: HNH endonuclease family protein, partial [Rickettsiales bacterium]|nr:HNH endonuclease family protein [Rickettsiales bacterium]
ITNRIANVLSIWDLSTFHPLILWITTQKITAEDKQRLYMVVESYIIRRELCGYTPKNFNKVVIGIIREAKGKENIVEAVNAHIASLNGDASKMPSNADIAAACEMFDAYGKVSSQKLRYILKCVEESMRTKFDEVTVATSNLSVEHILPQKWSENWMLKNGKQVDFESIWEASSAGIELDDETKSLMQERQRMVNTLGNLTLITGALNPSLSNAAWNSTDKKSGKKDRLGESLLALNREVAKVQAWNEETIKTRAALLAERINSIWPSMPVPLSVAA